MNTLEEIQHAIKRLPADERESVADWLDELTDTRYGQHEIEEPQLARSPLDPGFMTIDEYMEFEEQSQFRHEYVNGVVHAMSGPSLAHVRIAGKLFVAVEGRLHGGPCEAFSTDAKLRIHLGTDEIVYYPDLVVACNPEEWGKNYVCNPKLVAEVLSPSTRHIDRREKAMTYRRVMSIEEYVLLEQEEHRVTVHRRAEGWRPEVYSGPQAAAELRSVALSIPLTLIYAGTLPAA